MLREEMLWTASGKDTGGVREALAKPKPSFSATELDTLQNQEGYGQRGFWNILSSHIGADIFRREGREVGGLRQTLYIPASFGCLVCRQGVHRSVAGAS